MTAPRPRENRAGLAVATLLVVFAMFTSMDTIAKWLVTAGLPAIQVAFLRYAVHFVAILVAYLPGSGLSILRSNAPGIEVLRGVMLFASTVFNFAALVYLPLTLTTSIFFAAPLLIALMSVPILGEPVGPRRLVAIGVGFLGVLVITAPWEATFHWAMLYSLAALTGASIYFVLTRKIAGVDDNPTAQVFASGIATLALAPAAAWVWVQPSGALDWGLALLLGSLGALGHSLLTRAYRWAEASVLAPLIYVQILYASALSWIVFAEPPSARTLLGASIIIGSGLYLWWRERSLKSGA